MSQVDLVILILAVALPLLWWFRESLPFIGGKPKTAADAALKRGGAGADEEGDPRDFVGKMERGNKKCAVFYGSQTGTAEEFSIRLAKEAKSRFGVSSLVCDPEEYEFRNLDQIPEDKAVVFVMATYGEGEPTDNAQQLMEFLEEEEPEFSNGSTLENLNYVVFGLGNKTYEHYNAVARKLDERLTALGAKRIGERGEGDDDKALEEDYLAWKDDMWVAFAERLGVEEGGAGDVADFEVTEVGEDVPANKIFHGELSPRALVAAASGTTTPVGSYDSKNPYPAPVHTARELFEVGADRNCVHIEFDTTGTPITYQHGDHVGVWPSNPDVETERMLSILGLQDKRTQAITVESLDPALAKVPFPVPATYEAIFRHYLDISATASRQTVAFLARYAPNEAAKEKLTRWGSDRDIYAAEVDGARLTLGEVLQAAAGDKLTDNSNVTKWDIPFDRIISVIPRLQPRYYSISSSSKMHPHSIHVTAVVLKYESKPSLAHESQPRWVYGLSTNFIQNIKLASDQTKSGDNLAVTNGHANGNANGHVKVGGLAGGVAGIELDGMPTYKISGPRDFHFRDNIYRVPVHVRRSTFRLPTSPKVPIIMIGPGTGVAPFRGFVQERVVLAQRAKEKNGPDALKDWAPMFLFYGCRRADEDFLYKDEWPKYQVELDGKLQMQVAFSRGPERKPDGSKIYVQDLIWAARKELAPLILERRAYVYICGDAKNMAREVEARIAQMLGDAKGGSEAEGAKELKLLKERNRLLLDTWS
ncbi:electron transporter [Trichosporon asahii var. asahii CBS 2479]|uniref:NADPH--cytochrome P450 reductase n=1 Tax=Trichosporon asahii var. asahii (strain ATCC 90039 / CBS 2479 / JCM 2466 / KCTC 7840 / NBRC 103889/ NCYC 2677 / UAMH 7654) TaxID=1186058 RepID=J6EXS3_TRIAS|nr:electron transporter [Trichosporon asahii var. asahii CBS 2479]EJT47627.1 electron transporter [Trichosporon asahii var. asahii CBS 2479]